MNLTFKSRKIADFGCLLVHVWFTFGWRLVAFWFTFGSRLVHVWLNFATKKASHTHVQNALINLLT